MQSPNNTKVRVLIVDDSALVRQILTQGLSMDPGIEVVGSASDPYIARDKILNLKPDVLTLDVEMPRMDGVEFLRKLMPQHPLPVLMVSSLTQKGKQITLEALEAGAVDFVSKPTSDIQRGLSLMIQELQIKVKAVSKANVSSWKTKKPVKSFSPTENSQALAESTDKVVAIGASTGGTEAIRSIIRYFPSKMPGVVVVQHMPAGFTKLFAESLDSQSAMKVKEAKDGDRIMMGQALIAPGGFHLKVIRSGGVYRVVLNKEDKVNGHRPSVEVMYESVAKSAGSNSVGVILTGMGRDGATGLKTMRDAGARTLAQDKDSCVIYGMPKEAWECGGAERQISLDNMAPTIMSILGES